MRAQNRLNGKDFVNIGIFTSIDFIRKNRLCVSHGTRHQSRSKRNNSAGAVEGFAIDM